MPNSSTAATREGPHRWPEMGFGSGRRVGSFLARRVNASPLVDGRLGPERSSADLHGFRKVRRPVRKVVDALAVDAETGCDLVGRQVAGDVHEPTVPGRGGRSTARLGVVELLCGGRQ